MRELVGLKPNAFSIPFGIVGLASVWRLMAAAFGSPLAVADVLFVIAAVVWAAMLLGALVRLRRAPRQVLAEMRDPVLSPFWSLPWIIAMLLALGLEPHAHGVAKAAFVVSFAGTILYAGWVTGEWIVTPRTADSFHPGYVLPGVAGGFIGAEVASVFGMDGIGWLSFGLGAISWLVISSISFNRLFLTPMLSPSLVPVLAILIAPSAVGGTAYFQLDGLSIDTLAYALAGYTILMALVQVRLLPLYLRLEFESSFWAFTFSWAAVAALALRWIQIEDPPSASLYAGIAAGAVSLLVAAIAARTVIEVMRTRRSAGHGSARPLA